MTKYDWSNVPKNVNWIATDADGVANGFQTKPHKNPHLMWWSKDEILQQIGRKQGYQGDWRESLEERPSD